MEHRPLTLSRPEAILYARVLWLVTGGPDTREIQFGTGWATRGIYDALRDRIDERLAREPAGLELDELDFATLRAVIPVVLRNSYAPEFQTVTGYTAEDLAALGRKVEEAVREVYGRRGHHYARLGECLVRVPTPIVEVNVWLVAVPGAASWERVMPACAQGRRDEILGLIRRHFEHRGRRFVWVEREFETTEQLEQWATSQSKRRGEDRDLEGG